MGARERLEELKRRRQAKHSAVVSSDNPTRRASVVEAAGDPGTCDVLALVKERDKLTLRVRSLRDEEVQAETGNLNETVRQLLEARRS